MQRQTRKKPTKRKTEASPIKPKKKVKSSNQESLSYQTNSNPKSEHSLKKLEVEKLSPISEVLNINISFQTKPLDQDPYQHLLQWASKAYQFTLEKSQWIFPQIIRYKSLNVKRFVYVVKMEPQLQPQSQPEFRANTELAEIYLQKSERLKFKLDSFLKNITYLYAGIHYFRGPSGIGKSYALIQWIIENRKRDDFRILYVNLDNHYLDYQHLYFAFDFIYCFYKDLEKPDFPKPPDQKYNSDLSLNGEKWFTFLSDPITFDFSFLKEMTVYLKKKKIAFILIWDQDNLYQKMKKDKSYPFLESLRECEYFNLKLISASNENEGFKHLDENYIMIEENVGFSKEESKEYVINVLEKMYGNESKIDDELLEKLYELTGGNGYYLSQFVYCQKGGNYHEKFKFFINDLQSTAVVQMKKFFESQMEKNFPAWMIDFPEILFYLDNDINFKKDLLHKADKNFTYIENSKLKSVNKFAKEVFTHFYREKVKKHEQSENFLTMLKKEASSNECNPILKGILYERYVIQEFMNLKSLNFKYTLQKPKRKKKSHENLNCNIDFYFLTFSNEEIEYYIGKTTSCCLIKPAKFNNPFFDFIIWNGKEECLYIFQITINADHSSSDESFFTDEKYKFLTALENKVKIQFIWITNMLEFQSKYIEKEIGHLYLPF